MEYFNINQKPQTIFNNLVPSFKNIHIMHISEYMSLIYKQNLNS